MNRIKLIGPEDQNLIDNALKLPFDVEVSGTKLILLHIPERIHTFTSFDCPHAVYAYPMHENPTPSNVVPYLSTLGASWSIAYNDKTKLSDYYNNIQYTTIFRNNKEFLTIPGNKAYSLNKALYMLESLIPEHPLNLNFRGYDRDMIGRGVKYKDESGVIERYLDGEAVITIRMLITAKEIKVSIFDSNILY